MVLGGVPCKHLSIRDLAVFRVVFLPTLKTAILLIYNRLDDTLQKGSDRQQGCLREDLPPSALEGGACEAGGPGPHGGFLLLRITTSVRHNWRLLPDTIASDRHAQREKLNNLKLAQQTKALIHNQLADKAKARLPTFSHNLHLAIHRILLILSNIHRITTCRLFDSIQFCVCLIPRNSPHYLWPLCYY